MFNLPSLISKKFSHSNNAEKNENAKKNKKGAFQLLIKKIRCFVEKHHVLIVDLVLFGYLIYRVYSINQSFRTSVRELLNLLESIRTKKLVNLV